MFVEMVWDVGKRFFRFEMRLILWWGLNILVGLEVLVEGFIVMGWEDG